MRGEGNEKNRRFSPSPSPPSTEKSEKRVPENELNSDIALFTTEESNLSCNSQVAGWETFLLKLHVENIVLTIFRNKSVMTVCAFYRKLVLQQVT